jgi:hypothetical protein
VICPCRIARKSQGSHEAFVEDTHTVSRPTPPLFLHPVLERRSHTRQGSEIAAMTVCVVSLPLAVAFARHLKVIGCRRNQEAADALNRTMQGNFFATHDIW